MQKRADKGKEEQDTKSILPETNISYQLQARVPLQNPISNVRTEVIGKE